MIPLKDILLEAMRPNVATTIFAKYGVRNAAHLDKGQLRKYYMALVKRHHSDVGGNDEDMKWINAAYEVLKKNAKDVIDVELKPEDKIVNLEFRQYATHEVLDVGHCNRYEYLEILKKLKDEGITAIPKPSLNYDNVNDQWTVPSVAIYVEESDYLMVLPLLEPLFKH